MGESRDLIFIQEATDFTQFYKFVTFVLLQQPPPPLVTVQINNCGIPIQYSYDLTVATCRLNFD